MDQEKYQKESFVDKNLKRDQNSELFITVAFLFFLALSFQLMGCGKDNPKPVGTVNQGGQNTVQPAPVACAAGQVSINGACWPAATFDEACLRSGGRISTLEGAQVCISTTIMSLSSLVYSRFPVLNPDNPAPYYALNTRLLLKKGDRLSIQARGTWGFPAKKKFKWIQVVYYGNKDCDDFTFEGRPNNGNAEAPVEMYMNVASGLAASDGIEYFFVGNGVNRTMNNDGELRMGFNVDPNNLETCSKLSTGLNTITRTRCEDSTGKSYTCP